MRSSAGAEAHAFDVDDRRGADRCVHQLERRAEADSGGHRFDLDVFGDAFAARLPHQPAQGVERHAEPERDQISRSTHEFLRVLLQVCARSLEHRFFVSHGRLGF